KISNNRTNKALVTALESKNYISSFKEDRERLRVNTKKK
ncbi:hypothetical protein, partial [Bacillus subtilis]